METDDLKRRIYSIDLLRGIVMMIMMIDHVREFVHAGALTSDPTDPATTTVAFSSRVGSHTIAHRPSSFSQASASICKSRAVGRMPSYHDFY